MYNNFFSKDTDNPKKKLKNTIWIIVIIALILGSAIVVRSFLYKTKIIDDTKKRDIEIPIEKYNPQEDMNKRIEREKNTPSDINGMSIYDKRMNNFSPYDGADTDGDGLTDKEEIEVYGTDSLKASSAGDLYSDGYKVENGLDVNVEIKKDPEFSDFVNIGLFPEEVYPNPEDIDSIEERNAVIVRQDANGFDRVIDKKIYAVYNIVSFGGAVAVETDDILPEDCEKVELLFLESRSSNEASSVTFAYDEKNGVVAFDTRENGEGFYVICDAKKKILRQEQNEQVNGFFDLFKKSKDGIVDDALNELTSSPDNQVKFLVFQWQVKNRFFGKHPIIYYVSSGDEDYDEEYIELAMKNIDNMFGVEVGLSGSKEDKHLKRDDFVKISYWEYLTRKEVLDKAKENYKFFVHDYAKFKKDNEQCYFVMGYMNDDDIAAEFLGDDDEQSVSDYVNSPIMGEDTLPFQNFGSYISEGGNCAGFAALTAILFDTGEFPSKGEYSSYRIPGGYLSYDLTTDEENATLMDRFLSDYKDENFTRHHYDFDRNIIDNSTLTDGEKQFIDMIGLYWAKTNDRISSAKETGRAPTLYMDNANVYEYAYMEYLPVELFENLSQDKMYILAFSGYDENGESAAHAVNIVGYEWCDMLHSYWEDENGKQYMSNHITQGSLKLKIYDNNNPDELQEAMVYIRPSRNNPLEGVCIMDYEFGGEYNTSRIDNRSYFVSIMDENMEPFEYKPVVEIAKFDADDGVIWNGDYKTYVEDYLKVYPNRRFWEDKEEYNRLREEGYQDIENENHSLKKYE